MSKYSTFRSRTQNEGNVIKVRTVEFIEKSVSSTTIRNLQTSKEMKVVLTRDHLEGNSETLLFTYIGQNKEDNLKVGDYILHGKKHFLVYLEFDHPLKGDYLKYKLVECNITIKIDEIEQHAAYFSSMRKFINTVSTKVDKSMFLTEDNKPVVITSANERLKRNIRFLAAGEGFIISTLDKISNHGIYYLSVDPSPLNPILDNRENNHTITPPERVKDKVIESIASGKDIYKKGQKVALNILDGYVKFNPSVKVERRTMNTVVFEVPYDISFLEITTKNSNSELIIIRKEVI